MGRFSCLGIPKLAFIEESAHRHRRTPAATGHRDLDYDLRMVQYGAHSLPLALYCTRSVRDKIKRQRHSKTGGGSLAHEPLNMYLRETFFTLRTVV